jgi:hypothetical protein
MTNVRLLFSIVLFLFSSITFAEGIGKVKTLTGDVVIERHGSTIFAELGKPVYQSDIIFTRSGTVGLLFVDDSRLSLGPNSSMSLESFSFDTQSHEGNFDVTVKKGTLSVISGKLTAKRPGALKVKTPAAILAVRGTEFSVKVDEP